MRVLFVGINPGVRSALTGHHFAGFSNRFWKLLYESRLVPEPITFADDDRLPEWGYGITNIVARPTPGIDTLRCRRSTSPDACGCARRSAAIVPTVVALVGVTVFRAMFPERKGAGDRWGCSRSGSASRRVFVLPNPSGRNANFSYAEMLAGVPRAEAVPVEERLAATISRNFR